MQLTMYCARYFSITYNSVFNCPGAETTTLEITHKVQPRSVMDETSIFQHKALLSLHIARNQGHFKPTNNCQLYVVLHRQNNILSRDCSDQNFDLLFAPTEFAFRDAWFGDLDRDQLLPEVTLGYLEKGLLPPEDSSFSLGIQFGTLYT